MCMCTQTCVLVSNVLGILHLTVVSELIYQTEIQLPILLFSLLTVFIFLVLNLSFIFSQFQFSTGADVKQAIASWLQHFVEISGNI